MYDSLRNKLMTLPNHVIVYPAHGAGSSCGKKNLGSDTFSTIGEQKAANYALQPMSKEDFIRSDGWSFSSSPLFFKDVMMNKNGYKSIDLVLEKNYKALSPQEFVKEIDAGAFILDTRNPEDFAVRHLKSAVNIGLNGQYAPWVGAIVPTDAKIVLVTDIGKEKVLFDLLELVTIMLQDF